MIVLRILVYVAAGLALCHLLGPLLLGYCLRNDRLELRLFHVVPIRWVRFTDIAEISVVGWAEALWGRGFVRMRVVECWCNRVFVRSLVFLRPQNARFTNILLTPPDPKRFVMEIKANVGNEGKAEK